MRNYNELAERLKTYAERITEAGFSESFSVILVEASAAISELASLNTNPEATQSEKLRDKLLVVANNTDKVLYPKHGETPAKTLRSYLSTTNELMRQSAHMITELQGQVRVLQNHSGATVPEEGLEGVETRLKRVETLLADIGEGFLRNRLTVKSKNSFKEFIKETQND